MTKAERNYSACEEEALDAFFSLKRLRMYLLRYIPFMLETDQKTFKPAFAKRVTHGRMLK